MPFRALLAALLVAVAALAPVPASATRIAVIYAEADEPVPDSFSHLITSMESLPNVEIIRLALDAHPEITLAQLLRSPAASTATLRLAAAGGSGIAVLYPDIGEPYRSVFSKIIEGIEDKARTRVAAYAVSGSFNPQELAAELKRQDIRVVIALGRNGLKAASTLEKDVNVVAGGVISIPEGDLRSTAVHSLAPDPLLLFSRLRALSPASKRVTVIYDGRQNAWLIRLAREAARTAGLDLNAVEVGDLKTAVRAYQDFFAEADPRRDALWLPQDSVTVDETAILPLILQESWNRAIPVFSSTVSHVKRGVLFALYPNNVELGRNLAASALGIAGSAGRGLTPLREVLVALNTRTASHLGLNPGPLAGFDLTFPEP